MYTKIQCIAVSSPLKRNADSKRTHPRGSYFPNIEDPSPGPGASPKRLVGSFVKTLQDDGRLLTVINAKFPEFGDSIESSAKFILGINDSTQPASAALRFQRPPPVNPLKVSSFLVEDFTKHYGSFHGPKIARFLLTISTCPGQLSQHRWARISHQACII